MLMPVRADSDKHEGDSKALSVTQLLRRMKMLLEGGIGELWIEGEVSNLRKQSSGHWYFSLKDEGAQISCAMFSAGRRPGSEVLQDGAKVRVFAEASVYEARGQLQVIVQKAVSAGAGDLQAKFEALKRKLQAEGLFDSARKKPLPRFPRTIGLVTSATGAALQDMLKVLGRRAPWVQPVLFPVRVQGKGAELEIAAAIAASDRLSEEAGVSCDLLVVGRGGGSLEDLWNFNEEVVARAIAACAIPVISAVGHEIDFTIADFVADLRAPTPSAAIEMAVPDVQDLRSRCGQLRMRMRRVLGERLKRSGLMLDAIRKGVLRRDGERLLREPVMRLDGLRGRLQQSVRAQLEEWSLRLAAMRQSHRSHHPKRVLERRQDAVEVLRRRLEKSSADALVQRRQRLAGIRDLLRALGPESAFQRGFSITLGPDGKALRSVGGLKPGDRLRTKLADGEIGSEVLGGD